MASTSTPNNESKRFINYPEPVAAPARPYHYEPKTNPVVKGMALSIGASIISSLTPVQNYLWSNAGFLELRSIREIDSIDPRLDPTVIPVEEAVDNAQDTQLHPVGRGPVAENLGARFYTINDYHAFYRAGKLTPTAVVEALLPLIQRDIENPSEHSRAFMASDVDLIRKNAQASTERYKTGKHLSVLDGVPLAVKDETDVAGYKKYYGSKRDFTDEKAGTTWCVKKWEEAGAINLGKLVMHELGLDTTNLNPNYGTPLNPYNEHYYTGGSSGGSGYAVGAGLIPVALGADGGGSVRIPATYCGVYGLKPSHGRVSGFPSTSLAHSVGTFGPLAATMDDLEISYRIMAEPLPGTTGWVAPGLSAPLAATQPRVIGIFQDWFDRADSSVKAICQRTIDHLEQKLGYEVIPIEIPLIPQGQSAHTMTILSEIATGIKGDVRGLTSPNKVLVSVGSKTPAGDFLLAQKLRNLLMQHLAYLFRKHPGLLIVTPSTPNPGWHISGGATDLKYGISDGNMSVHTMEYTYFANLVGCPAISVPVGYVPPKEGEGDIPVGLMAMSEWGAEDILIRWGRECEAWLNGQPEGSGRRLPKKWVDVMKLATEDAD